jgi:hypothetical protein
MSLSIGTCTASGKTLSGSGLALAFAQACQNGWIAYYANLGPDSRDLLTNAVVADAARALTSLAAAQGTALASAFVGAIQSDAVVSVSTANEALIVAGTPISLAVT